VEWPRGKAASRVECTIPDASSALSYPTARGLQRVEISSGDEKSMQQQYDSSFLINTGCFWATISSQNEPFA